MSQFHPNEGAAITPHNSTAIYYNAIYVGDAGDIEFRPVNNTVNITLTVPAGWWYPGPVILVAATGTTCTKIHGFKG